MQYCMNATLNKCSPFFQSAQFLSILFNFATIGGKKKRYSEDKIARKKRTQMLKIRFNDSKAYGNKKKIYLIFHRKKCRKIKRIKHLNNDSESQT